MVDTITVEGADQVIKKLNKIAAGVEPAGLVKPMRDSTLLVTRDAKKLSPVDTGTLRSSIAPDITLKAHGIEGAVGSPLKYAPFVELGTRPHFPPLSALQVWARRHGVSARAVQLAIGRRGTKANEFLKGALENNTNEIYRTFDDYVKDLVD